MRSSAHGTGRRYRKLALTGENAIVAFVQRRGRASTAEINEHWRAEGRGGVANNAIVRLMKRGALVREPIPGNRGSWYRYGGETSHLDGPAHDSSQDTHEAAEHLSGGASHAGLGFAAEPVGATGQATFG
jgi:hypothetical protein